MKLQFPKIAVFPAAEVSTKKWSVLGIIGLLALALSLSLPPVPAEAHGAVDDAALQCTFDGEFDTSSTIYPLGTTFHMEIEFSDDAVLVHTTETANYSYGEKSAGRLAIR